MRSGMAITLDKAGVKSWKKVRSIGGELLFVSEMIRLGEDPIRSRSVYEMIRFLEERSAQKQLSMRLPC